MWLRVFQHLLPTGRAWRIAVEKKLRDFFEGLTTPYEDARDFIDAVHNDRLPATTRELAKWETQFGITPSTVESERRVALASAWAAVDVQAPGALQDTLRAAGFDVYVHEWWEGPNVAPRNVRDPRDYTEQPLIGDVQCGEVLAQCGEPDALCNDFLVNDPKYLVNDDLTRSAPPAIPANADTWRHFWYVGAAVFGVSAVVDAARRAEFERLIYKYKPAQTWVVTLVLFEEGYVPGLFYFGGGDGLGAPWNV